MTISVDSYDEKAIVDITPQIRTAFSAGSHVIYDNGCKINVHVINKGLLVLTCLNLL